MVRFVDSGGEPDDGLAPVTSLFGDRGAKPYAKTADDVRRLLDRLPAGTGATPSPLATPPPQGRPPQERAGWGDDPVPGRGGDDADAAAGAGGTPAASQPIDLDAARVDRRRSHAGRASTEDRAGAEEAAEHGLLKKLRARQLSVAEAKTYLGQHELDGDAVEVILDDFLARGYLDDARLAEQVVHAGVDRKGQGRQAISQSLAKRGVPRDVADAALAELPDDDAERALEFARTKAGSMRGLERDVALRRLAGQLARRGYGGSAALSAARQALDEAARPSGRVRFE